MLAGIGGRTVAQAKRNISWGEFQDWMAYRKAHGPLVLHQRMEDGLALVAHTVASTIPHKRGTKGPKISDFLPQRELETAKPIALEDAMKSWR